ncbi:MAG: hypothetical protein AAB650_02935 [Patescibacteria group bacterium]
MNNRTASGAVSPQRLAVSAVVHPALKFTLIFILNIIVFPCKHVSAIVVADVNLSAGLFVRSSSRCASGLRLETNK